MFNLVHDSKVIADNIAGKADAIEAARNFVAAGLNYVYVFDKKTQEYVAVGLMGKYGDPEIDHVRYRGYTFADSGKVIFEGYFPRLDYGP